MHMGDSPINKKIDRVIKYEMPGDGHWSIWVGSSTCPRDDLFIDLAFLPRGGYKTTPGDGLLSSL